MSSKTAWGQMIKRCYDPLHHKFPRYGLRGIRVCERWIIYRHFLEDMGERPEGKTLNRINNDGDYCPINCEWATPKQQARNTSQTKLVTYNGQTKSVSEWAELTGIKRRTLSKRLQSGWSAKNALSVEVSASNTSKGIGYEDRDI